MAISPQGIKLLISLLSRRVGSGSGLTNRAVTQGLLKGKSPRDMAKLVDARSAGSKGRRKGVYENKGDYPFGYVGPDPGSIDEMEELKYIMQNVLGYSDQSPIGTGRTVGDALLLSPIQGRAGGIARGLKPNARFRTKNALYDDVGALKKALDYFEPDARERGIDLEDLRLLLSQGRLDAKPGGRYKPEGR